MILPSFSYVFNTMFSAKTSGSSKSAETVVLAFAGLFGLAKFRDAIFVLSPYIQAPPK